MANGESGRVAYLRAQRKIESSNTLERYFEKVARIGNIALGVKDTAHLKHLDTPEVELQSDYKPVTEELGIAATTVYRAGLRYRHFNYEAKPDAAINRHIQRVYARLVDEDELYEKGESELHASLDRAAQQHNVNDSELLIRATTIDICPKSYEKAKGEEYGLRVDPGPVADYLVHQNQIIYDFIRSTGPGFELLKGYQAPEEVLIPFVYLPHGTEQERKNKFVEWVSSCIWDQPLTLAAGELQWKPYTPRVSTFS